MPNFNANQQTAQSTSRVIQASPEPLSRMANKVSGYSIQGGVPLTETTREQLVDMLSYCTPGDHDGRFRTAAAIYDVLGPSGIDVFLDFCGDRGKGENVSVYRSIRPGHGITVATIRAEANQHGYKPKRYPQPTVQKIRSQAKVGFSEAEVHRSAEQEHTAKLAREIVNNSRPAQDDHPYLLRKQIKADPRVFEIGADVVGESLGRSPKVRGELLQGRLLVVPCERDGSVTNIELIDERGRKTCLPGVGTRSGAFWMTHPFPDGKTTDKTFVIGEGFATVLTASNCTDQSIGVVAFSATNLRNVVETFRVEYPESKIIVLADLVKTTGISEHHAVKAAREFGALLAVPNFGADREQSETDFNDVLVKYGADAVRKQIESATAPSPDSQQHTQSVDQFEWPELQQFDKPDENEVYPIDQFPAALKDALLEILEADQAPAALIGNALLAAAATSVQGLANVERPGGLISPLALSIKTIAPSGERKTAVTKLTNSAILEFEAFKHIEAQPQITDFKAKHAAWQSKIDGTKLAIKDAQKKREATQDFEFELKNLMRDEPQPPMIPRLVLGDETVENLLFTLAKNHPSAMIASSEGGSFYGGHSMGQETAMRMVAGLNSLWDGDRISIGRRTTESFVVDNARLTMAIMVQPDVLFKHIEKNPLARTSGWLARFLIAQPQSLQGTREFRDPPTNRPALGRFNARVSKFLHMGLDVDRDGSLMFRTIGLTPEARELWIETFNAIEGALKPGGDLADVRDFASKAGDQIARVAGVFELFESGQIQDVSADNVWRAQCLVLWYLAEAKRLFGRSATEANNVQELDSWIVSNSIANGGAPVKLSDVQQKGPNRFRRTEQLNPALELLRDMGRVRLLENPLRVAVNPNLHGGASA